MTKTVEYRVRPVTRYNLTRWVSISHPSGDEGGCETLGEFDSEKLAHRMLEAAANHENRPEGVEMIATDDGICWQEA